MALFGNYSQPGRGVPKAPAEKKGIFKFFEVYGRKFWKLIELNVLYFLFFIPVILAGWLSSKLGSYSPYIICAITVFCFGPATAGLTKVARNFSQERNSFILTDFFDCFKKCFKQSFIMGLIDVIFILGFSVAIPTYKQWAEANTTMYVPFIICLSCLIVFFMMHFYIYLMIVSTNLTMKQVLKNAFFLVSLGIKSSIYTLLAWIITVLVLIGLFPYSMFILPFVPFSLLSFITAFNCYPVIRKHVIQPYYDARGEENPEFAYLKQDPDETLFEDKPELEQNPEPKPEKRKKGRTIS